MTAAAPRQPWLHDRLISVLGNATAVTAADGGFDDPGTGLLVDDRLILRRYRMTLDGEVPVPVQAGAVGEETRLWSVARNLGDEGPDPTVEVHLHREMVTGGMRDVLRVVSRGVSPVRADLAITLAGSGCELARVKAGRVPDSGPLAEATPNGCAWADERHRTIVGATPAPVVEIDPAEPSTAVLRWAVDLGQGECFEVVLEVVTERLAATRFDADPGAAKVDWSGVAVRAGDRRLEHLAATALRDLRALLLADPQAPDDVFAGAGTPWYLTLFGRDSLWVARMLVPFDLDLAAGTLRTLARRQGAEVDPDLAEEPGKILHEARRVAYDDAGGGVALPSVYYGTVDATALWVILLCEAWRHGLPEQRVRELLPNLLAALEWLRSAADNDLGVLRYVDDSGHGLANQGWKDSGDSMRHRDGRIAQAPIALVEAQAYAVEAAVGAARLLDALGEPGGDDLRSWAARLRAGIRARYWVEDQEGAYLAMALDGAGRPVDGVGSNMGHVLGTGCLDRAEVERTIARLLAPELLGDFGIGTLSRDNPAYNPIGYHTGSVWTHDTAIILLGMAREGRADAGAALARGLLDCAVPFDYRAPELFAGETVGGRPAPYPASCRPQGWAAASALAILVATLGLSVDVPARRVALAPMRPGPFGRIRVEGLVFGAHRFAVEVDEEGEVGVTGLPLDVEVTIT